MYHIDIKALYGKILRFAIKQNFALLGNRKFSISSISDFALDIEPILQRMSVGPFKLGLH